MNAGVSMAGLLLRVEDLRVEFGARAALSDVTFDLFAAETLGLVGESGSGKSTLARGILRLVRSSKGSVMWRGQDLLTCEPAALRPLRLCLRWFRIRPLRRVRGGAPVPAMRLRSQHQKSDSRATAYSRMTAMAKAAATQTRGHRRTRRLTPPANVSRQTGD